MKDVACCWRALSPCEMSSDGKDKTKCSPPPVPAQGPSGAAGRRARGAGAHSLDLYVLRGVQKGFLVEA